MASVKDINWFKWNGVDCTTRGMAVLTQPMPMRAPERVESIAVPGRSKSLPLLEGTDIYDDINLAAGCIMDKPSNTPRTYDKLRELAAWLTGREEVQFANQQDRYYKGRMAKPGMVRWSSG